MGRMEQATLAPSPRGGARSTMDHQLMGAYVNQQAIPLGISHEMDAEAVEILTKGLYAQKRKGKASDESSKRAKVDTPSSMTPTTVVVAFVVIEGTEVVPTVEVGTVDGGSMPPTFSSPPAKDQTPQTPTEREKEGEKKKKKKIVVKLFHKACPSESNDDSDNLGEDPFSNPKIVRNLTDKFAMSEVVDRMADLDYAWLIWDSFGTFLKEDLQTEVSHLQEEKAAKVDCLAKKKAAEVGVSKRHSRRRSSLLQG
ncbi:hypothetical protein COCNU_04G010130 [Cocos nucifera]|uniref:Uncharacterized protein n=1 Tax=Cocos nucifera TaxID=13894 RepID=A0A8K0N0H5_COCNU|nr:hypothetical protein COCNU_04G010130 [Cocos nucifera]